MTHRLFFLRQASQGRSLRPREALTLEALVDFGSERKLSVEAWDERAGADMLADGAGKKGWRKATAAAAILKFELSGQRAVGDRADQ